MTAIVAALSCAVAVLVGQPAQAAGPGGGPSAATKPSYIYGIDANNTIWEIDPVNKVFFKVNETQLASTAVSNSMAYDTARDEFFFQYRGTETGLANSLLFWDRSSKGPGSVVQAAPLSGIGVGDDIALDPANATYYDDAYWFLGINDQILSKVAFTYNAQGKPIDYKLTTYDLSKYAGPVYPAGNNYGDTAIDNNGILYGATVGGLFFKIDLTKLGNTSNQIYTKIADGLPSLQISFDATRTLLYAHKYLDGSWYSLSTSGTLTSLGFATQVAGATGFRDLGGAATTPTDSTCEITPPGDSNNQSAWPGEAVAKPPSVTVLTPDKKPLPGVDITFNVTAGGGNLGGQQTVTVATDANGIAVAPTWTLGTQLVPNSVEAVNLGTTCNLKFNATVNFSGIDIVKTPNPTTYAKVGDVITYTMVATNTGNVPLTNATITDTKVSSLACTPQIPVASLAPGAKITCTGPYSIKQSDIDAGKVDNTATTEGTDPKNDKKTDTDSAQVTGPPKTPGIEIVKTPTPTTYSKPGDVINYSLVSTNTGNVTLKDVTVTDPKLGSLTCSPSTPATLAPGEKVTCSGSYTIKQSDIDAGKVDNTANTKGTDPDGKDVTDTDTATVNGPPKNPQLTIDKVADPKTYSKVGDVISYTIVTTNTGNVTLTNVNVTDTKLASLVCTPSRPVASMAPGSKITCTGSYTIKQSDIDAGKVDNTATATGKDPDNNPLEVSDKETVTGPAKAPAIDVVKSADPASFDHVGQKISYTIVTTNTGNVTLTGVTVTDTKLAVLDCTPKIPVTLAPGDKITCTGDYSVTQADLNAGKIDNVASATGKDPDNQDVTDSDKVTVPGDQKPALDVEKTASPKTFSEVGETITYTIVTTNTGNVTLTAVTVTDTKVPTLTCSPATPVAKLEPGEQITCTGDYVVTKDDKAAGEVVNVASATGKDPNDKDVTDTDKEIVDGPREADLSITKTHPAGQVFVNDTVTFTLSVRNAGPAIAKEVKVVDTLPAALGFVSASGPDWTCSHSSQKITCTLAGDLEAGQSAPDIKVETKALEATASAENVAVVSSVTPDNNPDNNTAKDTVRIDKRPQIGDPEVIQRPGEIKVKPARTNAGQPVQMKAYCRFVRPSVAGELRYCKVKLTKKGGVIVRTNRPYPVRVRLVFWAPETPVYKAYREVRKYTIKPVKNAL